MRIFPFLVLLSLSACAQPFEGRVASRLSEAGLSRPMAQCMAGRWTNRLTVFQLRRISSLADDLKEEGRSLTVRRFVDRVRQVDDPEIFEVVSASALACALK
ncbi:hypothetical protein IC614_11270 [Allosphingosinicella flava]|uniref:Lipoprotein n=1 Tax=Allosphingosinicella flava TaxID=2771430 RepID=A0A7T2GJ80_9SPHN|nr:hypothetical protein [Sphingosinicella flava]QPQ54882.1 hypothetical protein IC614_11270 [Sphingosinicella flava]